MKNVNDILAHMKSSPEFKKLNTSNAIEQLISVLPPKLQKGVKFAYVKSQILFFVLKHPVYKMEFEYNKSLIKSLLKSCQLKNISDIQFFVTNKIEKKESIEPQREYYKERSYGIFENHAKNENIRNSFEEIRNIIKKA